MICFGKLWGLGESFSSPPHWVRHLSMALPCCPEGKAMESLVCSFPFSFPVRRIATGSPVGETERGIGMILFGNHYTMKPRQRKAGKKERCAAAPLPASPVDGTVSPTAASIAAPAGPGPAPGPAPPRCHRPKAPAKTKATPQLVLLSQRLPSNRYAGEGESMTKQNKECLFWKTLFALLKGSIV